MFISTTAEIIRTGSKDLVCKTVLELLFGYVNFYVSLLLHILSYHLFLRAGSFLHLLATGQLPPETLVVVKRTLSRLHVIVNLYLLVMFSLLVTLPEFSLRLLFSLGLAAAEILGLIFSRDADYNLAAMFGFFTLGVAVMLAFIPIF